MRKITLIFGAMWIILAGSCPLAASEGQPSVNIQVLESISLSSPELQADRESIGLSSQRGMRLAEIGAELLIISIFNTYCTLCQQDAAFLNDIHRLIQEDPLLQKNTKVIGIAIGNNLVEVAEFRRKYGIDYPLFADFDFTIEKAFSENLRTPTCLIAKITTGRKLEVMQIHSGIMTKQGLITTEDLLNNGKGCVGEEPSPCVAARGCTSLISDYSVYP